MAEVFTSETMAPPNGATTPRLARLGDLLDDWHRDAEEAHDARVNQRLRGPVTGITRLDRELGDRLSPGVHVLHAEPGVGKTCLALQIAATCGFPALFVSAEMSALELFKRHTAQVTGQYLGRFKSGELLPDDSVRYAREAAEAAPLLAIADATQAPAAPAWIRQVADVVKGEHRHVLVVVDSLHSWAESNAGDSDEYNAINAGIAYLRTLAKQLDCPILVVAERNRASMSKGGLSASAGSRKFEYSGESVIDLTVDQDAPSSPTGEVEVVLKLAKNRNGRAGVKIPLRFHGALQRFTEVER
jgi:replicative DNA helicase